MRTDTLPAGTTPAPNKTHRVFKIAMDGWSNFVTGLGTVADKRKYTKARAGGIMTDEELEDIWTDEGLGTNIVKSIPDDMFREGWEYEFPDEDELKTKELTDRYDSVLETIGVVAHPHCGTFCRVIQGGRGRYCLSGSKPRAASTRPGPSNSP